MQTAKTAAATGSEIQNILGPIDDELVADILRTGASAGEVREAFSWLNDDDYMGASLEKPMGAKTRRVYEILQNDRDRMARDER